jgi:hypothetical protein
MSFARRLDTERRWAPIVALAMVLTFGAIAFLLLSGTSDLVSTPPAAGPSYQAADEQAPSYPAEAKQAPADRTPGELAAPHRNPDDPAAEQVSASEMPSEQVILKSRRPLETIDPRELLRQATIPK